MSPVDGGATASNGSERRGAKPVNRLTGALRFEPYRMRVKVVNNEISRVVFCWVIYSRDFATWRFGENLDCLCMWFTVQFAWNWPVYGILPCAPCEYHPKIRTVRFDLTV